MKTYTAAPHCVANALKLLENIDVNYNVSENLFTEFLNKSNDYLNTPFIDGKINIGDVKPINKFLKDKGFDISLSEIGPNDIALASVIEIIVKWDQITKENTIKFLDKEDSIVKNVEFSQFKSFTSKYHNQPIYSIDTKEDFEVFVSFLTPTVKDDFLFLQEFCQDITDNLNPSPTAYNKISVPFINSNITKQLLLSTLVVTLNNRKYTLAESVSQTILKLDDKGAEAKAAVAMSFTRSCVILPTIYNFNRPFIIWFKNKTNNQVYFASHIFSDSLIKVS